MSASPRTDRGKNAARALRRTGRVPVVVYGHGDETQTLSVDALELEKLLGSIQVENTLIELAVEGGATTRALIREVQMHPYKPEVLHMDLLQVHAGEKLRLHVPVRLSGTPLGVRNSGGVLDQVLYDLEIECLPRNIPDVVEVDVGHLEIGESARVRDVSLPDVAILNDPDLPIASVVPPTVPVEPVGPDDTGASVEPELVRDRTREAEEPDNA
ncbi:MAG TPA: 50S ribosomal protein L25 [Longimicrobiaceae bacterium]|nr:50S ribosomal protein L25 [Longimicrobiaceae bacterium]